MFFYSLFIRKKSQSFLPLLFLDLPRPPPPASHLSSSAPPLLMEMVDAYPPRQQWSDYLLLARRYHPYLLSAPPNHVQWRETPECHRYTANLHGVKNEDVRVELEDSRYLVIRTEAAPGGGPVEEGRSFMRKFRLPDLVDVEGIEAQFEDGVLRVSVPRINARRSMLRIVAAEVPGVGDAVAPAA